MRPEPRAPFHWRNRLFVLAFAALALTSWQLSSSAPEGNDRGEPETSGFLERALIAPELIPDVLEKPSLADDSAPIQSPDSLADIDDADDAFDDLESAPNPPKRNLSPGNTEALRVPHLTQYSNTPLLHFPAKWSGTVALFLLTLLMLFWQFPTCAAPVKGGERSVEAFEPAVGAAEMRTEASVTGCGAVAGTNFVTPLNWEREPAEGDHLPDLPDSNSDVDDDDDGGLDDLTADDSSRSDHSTPLLSATDVDTAIEHTPHGVLVPALTVQCFYTLHEHIRERAPPVLG